MQPPVPVLASDLLRCRIGRHMHSLRDSVEVQRGRFPYVDFKEVGSSPGVEACAHSSAQGCTDLGVDGEIGSDFRWCAQKETRFATDLRSVCVSFAPPTSSMMGLLSQHGRLPATVGGA